MIVWQKRSSKRGSKWVEVPTSEVPLAIIDMFDKYPNLRELYDLDVVYRPMRMPDKTRKKS